MQRRRLEILRVSEVSSFRMEGGLAAPQAPVGLVGVWILHRHKGVERLELFRVAQVV